MRIYRGESAHAIQALVVRQPITGPVFAAEGSDDGHGDGADD